MQQATLHAIFPMVQSLNSGSVVPFEGFIVWCAARGEAKTRSESWGKVNIQSPHNTNVTQEQTPMFVQFVNNGVAHECT